jgi:hypothetical protein
MRPADHRVLLTTVPQRQGASGKKYLSGLLGQARIIGIPGEFAPDGSPTWNLYLQPRPSATPENGGKK